ncbi:MAG: peptidase T [Lachnospiraceae bacterium]|nr:peptidase T [Lachnospiraceae bacterium]
MNDLVKRFLRYVSIDTQSDERSETSPSSPGQHDLAALLYDELKQSGAGDVVYDKEHCYIYAKIPATEGFENVKTLGFISHMDTAPDAPGKDVRARIIENYDGGDIVLNEPFDIILETKVYPEIREYTGKSLIVTDGTTLLGADDKAGVAEIMTMAQMLLSDPGIKHGPIAIAFTPDEEIGKGTEYFDLEQFGADYAFTVDGGKEGELEYETFNAASAEVLIKGVSVHTGSAKGVMVNAARVGTQFDDMLPADQRPEFTEGREGFFHMSDFEGTVEEARLKYLIRDHDRALFNERKEIMLRAAEELNLKYGQGVVTVTIKDTYHNMREKIDPDNMFLIRFAASCMKELGIDAISNPVRGGTDGAELSFRGLPCPNIFTGGHNFHGRYEYCCIESMEKAVKLLVKLAAGFADI